MLKGWYLMRDFAHEHASDIQSDDWSDRVADARDRIDENVSNEMIDRLPAAELPQTVDMFDQMLSLARPTAHPVCFADFSEGSRDSYSCPAGVGPMLALMRLRNHRGALLRLRSLGYNRLAREPMRSPSGHWDTTSSCCGWWRRAIRTAH